MTKTTKLRVKYGILGFLFGAVVSWFVWDQIIKYAVYGAVFR